MVVEGYGVPYGLDISDVEDGVKSWQLVYPIIEWENIVESAGCEDEDHVTDLWFPVVLHPTTDSAGTAPGLTWRGQMYVYNTKRDAFVRAKAELRRLRAERRSLEQALTDLTVEAAATGLEGVPTPERAAEEAG